MYILFWVPTFQVVVLENWLVWLPPDFLLYKGGSSIFWIMGMETTLMLEGPPPPRKLQYFICILMPSNINYSRVWTCWSIFTEERHKGTHTYCAWPVLHKNVVYLPCWKKMPPRMMALISSGLTLLVVSPLYFCVSWKIPNTGMQPAEFSWLRLWEEEGKVSRYLKKKISKNCTANNQLLPLSINLSLPCTINVLIDMYSVYSVVTPYNHRT